ncbi:hypothetical protein Leryth_016620 [Lithospermum erythrorhizon]|uniref:Pectinesterase n=1 Tax=Lithospermum erythrorhizon TaxID=34254 RepID=A0AAV3R8C7_LITER|nr:hypothetical protein Leryth_016620 [Lithospermum erythrorhizon]
MTIGMSNWMFLLLVCCTIMQNLSAANVLYQKQHVKNHCAHTKFPRLCVETLQESGGSIEDARSVLSALVNKTIYESQLPGLLYYSLNSTHLDQQIQIATSYCQNLMTLSLRRLKQVLSALRKSPSMYKYDIQTWLSASLTFQETCKESVNSYSPTNPAMAQMLEKMEHLIQLSRNCLAIINGIPYGKPEPKTVPSWLSAKGRKLLQSYTSEPNVIVAKDCSGNFTTISDAIKAASGNRFIIYVKSGVYNESLEIDKDGITLIGDGKSSTIISGSGSVAAGKSLQSTATVAITGDYFIGKDIGFENTAGSQGQQAVALHIASDGAALYNCSISGYQDTLYAQSLRQFYRECDIYGTIDFIFGNAAAIFQKCNLILRKPGSWGAYNVILAHGRTDTEQNTGFVIQGSSIIVDSGFFDEESLYKSFLGRPWRQYARSVIIQSNIDQAIDPAGWIEWPGESGFAEMVYFAEHDNVGPGAGTSGRVAWPGFHVIGKEEAENFTVEKFISGNSWLPSTGVTYSSGLG